MPIYEYQCASCGARKELILKPGAEAKPACPACRKKMRRMISPTAFILKGSGWYVTDYPTRDRKQGLDADKGPSETKKETPAPEKPAPTPGPKPAAEKKGKRRNVLL